MLFTYPQNSYKKKSRNILLAITALFSSAFILFGSLAVPNTVFASVNAIASRNWSGYISSGVDSYTGIGAGWTVPKASGTSYSADATWVGISGIRKPDLIQVGTHAVADKIGLNTSGINFTYKAWYEILPSNPVIIPVAIKPGDSIVASIVQQSSNRWLISFNNVTTNQKYVTSIYYASSMSSAEWIQEMPLSTGTNMFVPLDNFGTISFTNTWAIVNGNKRTIQQLGGQRVSMLNYSNQLLAITSTLGFDGASFSVARTTANVTSSFAVGQIIKKIPSLI